MKKGIVVLVLMSVFGGFSSLAQHLKVAHINYLSIVDSLPSKKRADKDIEVFLKDGEKMLADMQAEYQKSLDIYLATADSLSPIIKELKEKQLMEQQQIIQIKSESLQTDLQILNERAYKPIEDKLKKAIAVVAAKYEVTYVLEESNLMYVGTGLDLTGEVRLEMMKTEAP